MAEKAITMECTGCGHRRSDVTLGECCLECEDGHYGEPVGAPDTPEEPKAKRKTNKLRWLEKEPESDGCMYVGPEFTSQPKAEAWLEESGKPKLKHDLVRITVRDAAVEETVQRKLVYSS